MHYPIRCPLCNSIINDSFCRDSARVFFSCNVCALIFAAPESHLSPADEKARYDHHQNSPSDPNYRRFLNRLAQPLIARLNRKGLSGLDFGCGPGPTLSVMLQEAGYPTALYDPFYYPDETALSKTYDFIVCTEAIEHFFRPGVEWKRLLERLNPGGWLGIMTSLAPAVSAFPDWHYKNDPTHVCFFRRETFEFLARRDQLSLEIIGSDVIIIRKSDLAETDGTEN